MRNIASKFLATAALGTAAVAGTGCYAGSGVGVAYAPGFLYSDYTYPAYANGGGTVGTKSGEAMITSILGLVATGDASIRTAASNGGISEVMTVDTKVTNILGIYSTVTTVVSGE
ncbi:MAG: TRL-like family protein [Planctomycetota bacterium]